MRKAANLKLVEKPDTLLAVSIQRAVELTGIGRSSIYEEINRGKLKVRKLGKRVVILVPELRDWLNKLPKEG